METFQVHILAADRTFYEGPCESLTISTSDGELGILAGHSPIIAAVLPGTLRYTAPGAEPQTAAVSPGMVKVEGNDVLVLVDSAERPEEIDAARAQREADEAKEALLQQRSRQEHQLAQATLARALNRLRIKASTAHLEQ
ncbi:ATP synthase F1 subunit epsilon [Acutalibacter caecimuris]|uniref:ATP synthase F1 subunit epsilon n=1 Tax=Acutalibacter caecimuris TaxID=3093657 RepID=UPI002AC99D9B|nr:ATP synthase F1 subunit epsilon [Acutalibacter sp. M00118]